MNTKQSAQAPKGQVQFDRFGKVAVLRLDRPAASNALNLVLLKKLAALAAECDSDPDIACIVITGGDTVFSAGADIDMLSGHTAESYVTSENRQAFDAIRATQKPVIAAVAGYCLGGGCEIALGCDLIIAADTAQFGQPEVNLGIIPGAGGTQLWSIRGGAAIQARMAFGGGMVSAYETRRLGIVNSVVPARALIPAAVEMAQSIAEKAPLATRAAKQAMRAPWKAPLSDALEQEVGIMAGLLATEDAAEGIGAFLEKRKPAFTGR